MASRFIGQTAQRVLLIGVLAVLTAFLLIPRAASQETRTLDLDIVFTDESFEIVPALGNQPTDEAFMSRGDVLSGQGAVYAAGDAGGERRGTFYFMGTGTAEPEHFETAANHFYALGYFELFGEGTLAITGVVNFNAPYTLTITGGTGIYAMASGQCTATATDEFDTWACEVY